MLNLAPKVREGAPLRSRRNGRMGEVTHREAVSWLLAAPGRGGVRGSSGSVPSSTTWAPGAALPAGPGRWHERQRVCGRHDGRQPQGRGLLGRALHLPHLISFRERVRVDANPIPEEDVVRLAARLRVPVAECGASMFEATTAVDSAPTRTSGHRPHLRPRTRYRRVAPKVRLKGLNP